MKRALLTAALCAATALVTFVCTYFSLKGLA